jgi:hypothetical protein
MKAALRRVEANKGAAGVDGMTVAALRPYLMEHWPRIKEDLFQPLHDHALSFHAYRLGCPMNSAGSKFRLNLKIDKFFPVAIVSLSIK